MKRQLMQRVDAPERTVCKSELSVMNFAASEAFELARAGTTNLKLDPIQSHSENARQYNATPSAEQSQTLWQTVPVNGHSSGNVVEQVLSRSAYASIRAINVRVERDVVVLQGNVPSFYLRQLALAAAMKHLPGVFIVDFIDVGST